MKEPELSTELKHWFKTHEAALSYSLCGIRGERWRCELGDEAGRCWVAYGGTAAAAMRRATKAKRAAN